MNFIRLFFLVSCFHFVGLSQKVSFVEYSTSEGMPQSQVTAITQDSDGYLWIGTLGGLARFNGKNFVTFSSESGLLNNRISFLTLIEDEIWIGHEGGVTLYNGSAFKKWGFKGDDKSFLIKSIIKFKGKTLIATNGGGIFEINKNKLLKLQNQNSEISNVRDLLVCKNRLYIATKNGIYFTNDLVSYVKIKSLNNYNISSLKIWNENIIITTFENGLHVLNPEGNSSSKIQLGNDNLLLRNSFVDSKGNCWINAETCILKIDKSKNISIINESRGLPECVISNIYEDHYNNIWLGTSGKGLLRFPGEDFVYFNTFNGFSSDLILNVNQDKSGDLWFGTFDKGLNKMSKNGIVKPYELLNKRVWTSAFNINGYNWFGTDGCLVKMSPDEKITYFYKQDGTPGDAVTTLYKIGTNQMYLGGSEGVSKYKDGEFKYLIKSKNIGTVRDFEYLNNVLFCGASKGLFVYRKNLFKEINQIQKPISCIQKDLNNNIWIGTEEGLFIYSKGIVRRLFFSSIPSSNLITFLNFKGGKMFVGTNNGLYTIFYNSKINSAEVSHFGVDEGLVDIETNLNSGFFDKAGYFWFGTSSGLVRYKEGRKLNFFKPKINLKSILLNYAVFPYSKYSKRIDIHGLPSELILPYSKNNLTFEIDGISFTNHSDLNYQFWLEGLDEDWSPPSKNTIISFTGLSPDKYILHIKTIDGNGMSSNDLVIPFVIKPAFFMTWWFFMFVGSVIILLIYQFFRFKIKRELEKSNNEMIEYKSKLMSLEQKSLNASMNRHFIFNSLNSIQYFINSQDRLSANRYLTNFAKLIRKNLDSTNEEGNMISLTQELEGLELYLSLEAMRFRGRFTYEIKHESINTDSVIIPAMLLQPFIENCIIHGILPNENKLGLISIIIQEKHNILTIQIDDNGIGIKNSMLNKKGKPGDHRSQGMEITAKRIDLIKKISNKEFEIIGPFQIDDNNSDSSGTRVLLKIPFENLDD